MLKRRRPVNNGMWKKIKTPLGVFEFMITDKGVARVLFPGQKRDCETSKPDKDELKRIEKIVGLLGKELKLYFSGKLKTFSVPLDLSGTTAFRKKVWTRMKKIPCGKVMTYGELAAAVGCGAARAAGQACGANPVPLVVPCHRVVASGGKIGGWSGAKGMKEKLLHHEGVEI